MEARRFNTNAKYNKIINNFWKIKAINRDIKNTNSKSKRELKTTCRSKCQKNKIKYT